MIVLGLTGTPAAGKSTVAGMFADAGAAAFDADRAVHQLYRGAAAPLVEAAFPGTTGADGVDRAKLAERVANDPAALTRLEAIVHPLVREAEDRFRAEAEAAGRRVAVLDVPLLLETGGEARVDAVVVVSAPADTRNERAARRGGTDADRLAALAARQMSDADKRARAHFVIDNAGTLDTTRKQVGDVLRAVAGLAAGR